jgi:hypothetical protein
MNSFPFFASLLFFLLDIIREINFDPKLVPQFVDTGTMRTDDTPYELSIDVEVS